MSSTAELGEYYGNESDLVTVYTAARNAGYASAMLANLQLGGSLAHAELWEAEQTAWLERRDKAIREAPLGVQWLGAFASEVIRETFDANALTTADLLSDLSRKYLE